MRRLLNLLAASLILGQGLTSIHATDCDGNGIEGAKEIELDDGLDCDTNGILDFCEVRPSPIDFRSGRRFPTGTAITAIEFADFDGDGLDDALVANFISDSISILRGTDDGGFAEPRTFPIFGNFLVAGDRRAEFIGVPISSRLRISTRTAASTSWRCTPPGGLPFFVGRRTSFSSRFRSPSESAWARLQSRQET